MKIAYKLSDKKFIEDPVVMKEQIEQIKIAIIKLLKEGLPEEAQTPSVFNSILGMCKEDIGNIPLDLEKALNKFHEGISN